MPSKNGANGRRLFLPTGVLLNERQVMNGLDLLAGINPGTAALAWVDPQYRGVLDKQKYGNEGARQKGRTALPQMTDQDIAKFIDGSLRALRPSGHIILWVDKFTIASGRHLLWWDRHMESLNLVDLIIWNKIAPGMGSRSRCYYEGAIVLQKEPRRAKGIWNDRGIMDVWPESADRSIHPHAKPVQFIYRMIRCLTSNGDLVVDPCAGGYTVLSACVSSGRNFLGCDLIK